jgi:SRSO17 transposase
LGAALRRRAAHDGTFREGLEALGLSYAVGIQSSTALWAPGTGPLPPPPRGKMGRLPRLLRRDKQHQPLPAKEIASCLTAAELRRVTWREGTRGSMRSHFAALRVRVAHRDYWRSEPHPEQWLLIEWPAIEKEPSKYWLSNLPASMSLRKLVAIAKLRWRIERDYEELKQELGLGHFEGRNWRGFHSPCHPGDRRLRLPGAGAVPISPLRQLLVAPNWDIRFPLPSLPPAFTPRGATGKNRTA